jgi:hypothetical protein
VTPDATPQSSRIDAPVPRPVAVTTDLEDRPGTVGHSHAAQIKDRAQEQRHLVQAGRHIAEVKAHILRERVILARTLAGPFPRRWPMGPFMRSNEASAQLRSIGTRLSMNFRPLWLHRNRNAGISSP